MTTADLAGARILVVEDELLIAMEIEAILADLGCAVVGPAATLEAALGLASDQPLDAAILDVTIRGGNSVAVAERLLARRIPFVVASGYGEWLLPDAMRDQVLLLKPFRRADLEEKLRLVCQGVSAPGSA